MHVLELEHQVMFLLQMLGSGQEYFVIARFKGNQRKRWNIEAGNYTQSITKLYKVIVDYTLHSPESAK